jgi:hypothetical protein
MKKSLLGALGGVAIVTAGFAGPASAQPVTQRGLVNLNVSDVGVQIPVSLAANVCDVSVAVLVTDLVDGAAPCDASSASGAMITTPDGGPVSQRGLVNVNVSNVAVQVPIGIAANVCDVSVGVLVQNFVDQADACDADAVSITQIV